MKTRHSVAIIILATLLALVSAVSGYLLGEKHRNRELRTERIQNYEMRWERKNISFSYNSSACVEVRQLVKADGIDYTQAKESDIVAYLLDERFELNDAPNTNKFHDLSADQMVVCPIYVKKEGNELFAISLYAEKSMWREEKRGVTRLNLAEPEYKLLVQTAGYRADANPKEGHGINSTHYLRNTDKYLEMSELPDLIKKYGIDPKNVEKLNDLMKKELDSLVQNKVGIIKGMRKNLKEVKTQTTR